MTTRAEIVSIARSYVDTPFGHLGRVPGRVLDCLGLIICTARAAGIVPGDFDILDYSALPDGHSLLARCEESPYLRRVRRWEAQIGTLLVVAIDKDPQHFGLIGDYRNGGHSIIHASNGAHPPRVLEHRLMFSRMMRYVAAFEFRGVDG